MSNESKYGNGPYEVWGWSAPDGGYDFALEYGETPPEATRFVRASSDPEDVFSAEVLKRWAKDNGMVEIGKKSDDDMPGRIWAYYYTAHDYLHPTPRWSDKPVINDGDCAGITEYVKAESLLKDDADDDDMPDRTWEYYYMQAERLHSLAKYHANLKEDADDDNLDIN